MTTTTLRPATAHGTDLDRPADLAGAVYRFFRGRGFDDDAAVTLTVRVVNDVLTRRRLAAVPAERRVIAAVRTTLRTTGGPSRGDDRVEDDWRRAVLQARLAGAVGRVRAAVSPKAWSAFRLTAVDGQPVAAAAAELGLSAGEVVLAKCRVLARLGAALAASHGE